MTSSSRSSNPYRVLHMQAGNYAAEIITFGGGIKSLTVNGYPLVETYPDGEYPPLSAGVVLAPWPNRTADGKYEFAGKSYQLELTEPDRSNAIHGFAGSEVWDVVREESGSDSGIVVLRLTMGNRQGWPWSVDITAQYTLDAAGLHAEFTANSAQHCPYAFGLHTYLSAWGAPLDECVLQAPLQLNLPLDHDRKIPIATAMIPADDVLKRADIGAPMLGVQLDHCFRVPTSAANMCVLSNKDGRGVEMRTSENLNWYQIYTADPSWDDGYPFPDGPARAVAVEPMSAPPNALRSGIGLETLGPGHSARHSITLRARDL